MAHIDDPQTQKANLAYIRKSMDVPLLEREHELDLATRWRTGGDERALHELVTAYLRLVVATAARFRNYGLPMGDLVQEGNIGLMQAAAQFEPEREVRFSTYASWWIRSAIQDYILRNWSIVRTGTTAAQKALFFNLRRLRAQIKDHDGGRMTDANRAYIADQLRVEIRDVETMEQRLSGVDQSLNTPISEEGDDSWMDFLACERATPETMVAESHDGALRTSWLMEAMGELTDREQLIIRERRLTEDSRTLEELGQQLGVSKERVRQLESRALGKLKVAILRKGVGAEDLLALA